MIIYVHIRNRDTQRQEQIPVYDLACEWNAKTDWVKFKESIKCKNVFYQRLVWAGHVNVKIIHNEQIIKFRYNNSLKLRKVLSQKVVVIRRTIYECTGDRETQVYVKQLQVKT